MPEPSSARGPPTVSCRRSSGRPSWRPRGSTGRPARRSRSSVSRYSRRFGRDRAAAYFKGGEFSAEGAHALALYVCGPADLFEAIKLPRPVDSRAVIDNSPLVEPLVELGTRGGWCVLLVNRQTARMLRGSRERLGEPAPIEGDVHRQHDHGGSSQSRYQRSGEQDD